MTVATAPSLGVTLFSFTNEWKLGRYDLDGILAQVALRGVGPGVELVGYQSIRGYPTIDREFAAWFVDTMAVQGLQPTCLGSNIDVARRGDRFMTTEESVEVMSQQIRAATALGFPVLRIQVGVTPEVLERIAPLAEGADVTLGMELHAPEGAATPRILAVREAYERIGSPKLGFIPDFSATMTSVPGGMLASFERLGLSREVLDLIPMVWHTDGTPHERFEEFAGRAAALGADPAAVGQVRIGFSMFGRQDPQSWREILPQVVHVHGKFYEIDENGLEPSIPYADLMAVLRDGGYQGTISSEWEGHAFADVEDVDAFEIVGRHQEMCRRLLDDGAGA